MESKYPRMHSNKRTSNLWGDYFKSFGIKSKRGKDEPTRSDIEAATKEYLKAGGHIAVLPPINDPGEFAKARGSSDFLKTLDKYDILLP